MSVYIIGCYENVIISIVKTVTRTCLWGFEGNMKMDRVQEETFMEKEEERKYGRKIYLGKN
jgi:hypothetical protein